MCIFKKITVATVGKMDERGKGGERRPAGGGEDGEEKCYHSCFSDKFTRSEDTLMKGKYKPLTQRYSQCVYCLMINIKNI